MGWHRRLTLDWRDLGIRVAWLFMIGSSLFAVGSFPPYAQLVDPGTVGITFVIGSLFFTAAGYSQFLQVINDNPSEAGGDRRFRFWAWQPNRMVWWAVFVQSIGTLFFNFNTIDAMLRNLTIERTNRLIWAPDFFGSIAFLVASHLAWLLVCGRIWCVQRENADWWIAALNYVGSIFFMISAITAFTVPTTGEVLNLTLVNLGTFAGAVCFLVGAYLLLPPVDQKAPSPAS